MKILLVTSLILNLVLFAAAARRGKQNASVQFPRPLRVQVSTPNNSTSDLFKRSSPEQPPTTPWQRTASRDPAQFVANLRAIGCPEQTIRDILVTRVSREFQTRLQTASDDIQRRQSWWSGTKRTKESLEFSQLRPALRRERDDLIEALFGQPANRLIYQVLDWPAGTAVGHEFMPEAKRQPLREIEERYARLGAETTFPLGEPLDDEERAALADLQRRKRAEIEALLSPQELEELDLRESPAALYVLRKLPAAETKEDFRAMWLAARELGGGEDTPTTASTLASRYGLVGADRTADATQPNREAEQQKAIEARAKELLGERRFTQLQQAEAARQSQ